MFLESQQLIGLDWFSTFDILRLRLTRMRAPLAVCALNLLVIWPAPNIFAAGPTIHAQSCTFSAVQAAVHSGATGDMIMIPAGTCDWGANRLTVVGGISLKGAGKAATIIRGSSGAGDLVTFDCSNGKTSNFSDITLTGKGNPAIWDGGLTFSNGCKDFMVFNSKFSNFINHGIEVEGNSRGVIFKNEFTDNYRAGQTGGTTGYGVVVYGNATWPLLELGTANAVFVEDNVFFGNRHDIASNDSSRYVFRHNNVTATVATNNFVMVDAHGKFSSPRGSRSWEVYDNTFAVNYSTEDAKRGVIAMGGGDGVIFNNKVTTPGMIASTIELWTPQSAATYPAPDQMTSGYFWNNDSVTAQGPRMLKVNSVLHHVEGRDYFLYPKPGYAPYTYPHPLRNMGASTPPSAPSSLKVR
jgi:hypothetical protein